MLMIDSLKKGGPHDIPVNDMNARVEAVKAFNLLHSLGHAITIEYVYDSDKKLAQLRVHHYLSCKVCTDDKSIQRNRA